MALLPIEKRQPNLLLPADNHTILNPETFQRGFTQSEIGQWDDCAEKWYLGYNHRLELKGAFEWHFIYGDGVHESLESFYKTGEMKIARLQFPDGVAPTAEQERDLAMWQAILQIQMEQYAHYRQDDLEAWTPWAIEEVIETEYEGIKLRGKVDLGYCIDGRKENILTDHKSYGLDDYEGWNFRFQFMFYIWLAQRVLRKGIHKFEVNGVRKPQLRLGKNESIESFMVRIRQAMIQEPEKYFVRHPLPMIANSMEHFEKRVLQPKIERIKLLTQDTTSAMIIETLARNQVTATCVQFGSKCQFLPICKHGSLREGHFYQCREHKHQELQPCK